MVPGDSGPPIWITARSCGSRAACNSPGCDCRKLGQQRVQHLHVVGGLERGGGDDRGAADLGEREFEFAQAIGRIDGDENEPGLGGGELRQRPFRPVQRPDADPRAAFEAEREKARGQRIDALGQFPPRPAHVMARRNQRLAIAPALRGLIEAAPDGVAQQRRVGDAADVAVGFVGQIVAPCVGSAYREIETLVHASRVPRRDPPACGGEERSTMPVSTPPSARCRHRARHRRRARSPQKLPGLGVDERQQLHQDHAGDVARRVDPEIGVGEAGPGEAAGAAAFRRLGGVDQEARAPIS